MTERERLIELLRKNNCCVDFDCSKCMTTKLHCFPYNVADYLLANGVVALPCKVGQRVYVIETCTCYNDYSQFDKCHHRRTKATKWIDMIRMPTKHHTKCLKLFARPFKLEYLHKVGKTVFLTKEEAEQALKEGEGE